MNLSHDQELAEIWRGDVLGRASEAYLIVEYIRCVVARKSTREDKAAFSISVDAGYGEGKTFFLTRLAKQLALTNPVAYVDAWADDLLDEPLTALLATLNDALGPLLQSNEVVRERWEAVKRKTGAVAKIAAKGAFKRGLGFLITAAAVEGIEDVMDETTQAVIEATNETAKEVAKHAGEGVLEGLRDSKAQSVLNERIADFAKGRRAVSDLKISILRLVDAVSKTELSAPIIIIIDELDRCRPTYAIKLLEEIKHLFDVPGLLFILGTHTAQLAHSVTAAYGPGFDGRAYLRRFVDREYRLRPVGLRPLVGILLEQTAITYNDIALPHISDDGKRWDKLPLAEFIERYMDAYGLTARDAFSVVDMLETCVALSPGQLIGGYLIPLIASRLKGCTGGTIAKMERTPTWKIIVQHKGDNSEIDAESYAKRMRDEASKPDSLLESASRNERLGFFEQVASHCRSGDLDDIRRYPELVDTVGRLRAPAPDQ